jgi:hypothetical protein
MKRVAGKLGCLIILCLSIFVTQSTANPHDPTIAKPASPPPIDFSELDKLVPEELKEKNTPGAVITVISGDQVVYQKAFGVANVETNAPMQPEMLFRLGSTTKNVHRRRTPHTRRTKQDQHERTHSQSCQRLERPCGPGYAASPVEQLRRRKGFCRARDLE